MVLRTIQQEGNHDENLGNYIRLVKSWILVMNLLTLAQCDSLSTLYVLSLYSQIRVFLSPHQKASLYSKWKLQQKTTPGPNAEISRLWRVTTDTPEVQHLDLCLIHRKSGMNKKAKTPRIL